MRKFAALVLTTLTASLGMAILADKPATGIESIPPPSFSSNIPGTTLDGIEIPFDVLMYAQWEYQGYAITKASKSNRDGKQVYSLRVDKDDVATDYDSFYLLYDSNWKLIGKEKQAPPPPPPQSETAHPVTPAEEVEPQPTDHQGPNNDDEEETEDPEPVANPGRRDRSNPED